MMKFSKDLSYIVFLNENKEEQKTEVNGNELVCLGVFS